MLSCQLKITSGGIYHRDLSLINHPCFLGYKGEVGYIYYCVSYVMDIVV